MSSMDERSKKIKEIVDKYRNGGELFLPDNPDLENKLDDVIGNLRANLSPPESDSRVISKLQELVKIKYRRYIQGVRRVPLPSVPNTADGLYEFIADKSTPYQVVLVHHAMEVLEDEDLKRDLQDYESKLAEHLKETLMSCKRRRVTLSLRKDHTHMAVVLSKEQVLLSLVLDLKEYFSKYLQLEETLFEGFQEDCTVLFFSILRADAVLLSPEVLSHLSELKRIFGMTHLIVFGYFACDLEKATIELVSDNKDVVALKTEKNSYQTESEKVTRDLEKAKPEMEKPEMEREKAEMEREKAEMKNSLIAKGMKLKVKEEELDQSKKEAKMYLKRAVQLAEEKFKLEEELTGMDAELEKLRKENIFLKHLPGAEGLKIGEYISKGDHKSVYRGTYDSRPVAVKKISDILVNRESTDLEQAVKDLKRACQFWIAANNPNIVSCIGVFNDETQERGFLLVMELMEQTLEMFLKENRRKLAKEKQISLCNQITSGLSYLHNRDPQVIHKDFKSRKIFLNQDGDIKIGGLSQAKFLQYSTPTQSGTAQDMPETRYDKETRFTDKDDVFSLGVVMLDVVTQEPCRGLEGINAAKMISKIPSDHPLKKLISQCLEDNPDKRPDTTEIHRQILRLRSNQPREEVSANNSIPSWKTQYEKVINSCGSVSLNIIRCILVGPPRVGKSCLKHLLVHNEPKKVTIGTPLLESPEVVTLNSEQPKTHQGSSSSAPEFPKVGTFIPKLCKIFQESPSLWQPLNTDDMEGIIKEWIMKEEYKPQETQRTRLHQGEAGSTHTQPKDMGGIEEQDSTTEEKQSGAGSNPPLFGKSTKRNMTDGIESKVLRTPPTLVSSNSMEPSSVQHTDLQECHDKLLLDLENGDLAHVLRECQLTLIHLLDSGGQPAFQDTLPLLIGTPCTYIAVFNASVDLDRAVDITYRAQDGSETKLDHQFSQWDMMHHTFSSVHTMKYKCHEGIRQILQDGSTLPHSRIAVVGTHKDVLDTLPNQLQDDLKKKMTTLLGGIEESKPYRLLPDQFVNPFFLMDNLERIDQDYINSLRNTLSSKECVLPLKVPLMWLMVELTTQRMNRKFIRYNELMEFCLQRRYINKEDADAQFHSLVIFLHNIGFYAFYDLEGVSKADNWVCTDAATLYREVSKLLIVQYMKNPHMRNPSKAATRLFKNRGIVEDTSVAELFNEVKIDPEIDHHWLLNVLHHIGIAAKVALERCQRFFIPLVLPFNRAVLPSKTSVSPLCFTLVFSDQSGPFSKPNECDLPRGIFPYLIVHLANQHHTVSVNGMWKINTKHSDRTHIVFDGTKFSMWLNDQAGHMELAIFLAENFFHSKMGLENKLSKLHSLCRDIRQTVTTAINSTCEHMFGRQFVERAKVQCGFLCTCGEGGPHLAFLKSTDLESAKCSIGTPLLSRKLSSRENIWFSPEWSEVEFNSFENDHDTFQIMEDISDTKPSRDESAPFDPKTFMDTYGARFMECVPAEDVVYKWKVQNIINQNTLDEVKRALSGDKRAILFEYMKNNGSLQTIKKMSDLLIETGEHGYPHVKSLGEDMREDLNKYP